MSKNHLKFKNVVLSSKKMRSIDRYAIERIGIPELVLMENAGFSIFHVIKQRIPDFTRKNFLILAGTGNNGGDALVVARHLKNYDVNVQVLLVGKKTKLTISTKTQMKILKKLKVKVVPYSKKTIEKYIEDTDVCIDGLLGTGFSGKLREPQFSLVEKLNKTNISVLSIDVPSGLNADNGKPQPIAVKANWTITLGAYKKGLFTQSSTAYVGKLQLVDIGLPIRQWLRKRKK
ncbi:MAG: NAD(P)H-hydrate epimerase [Candidatus Margulisbacteria bacterium]|nr:NAD(P)H-hydrate epimerase [Candidatus Margulisiibacteriota bacterium]